MEKQSLVSVIIIFFNSEKYLQEAIESVLAQTYPHWELLLADDGSSDNSTALARRYAEQHPERVFYLEHPGHQNHGMSATRNLGIRHSRGEYLAFLDSDDVWLPHKLEQQVALLHAYPQAGLVHGASLYWHSWTGNPADRRRDRIVSPGVPVNRLYQPPQLFHRNYPLGKATAPCPSDILVKREVAERVGGFEEEFRSSYQLYEDQAFLSKVYLATPVYVAGTCWIYYRQHEESCISTSAEEGRYHTVRAYFLDWLADYLEREKIADREVRRKVRRARRVYRYPPAGRFLLHFISGIPRRTKKLFRRLKSSFNSTSSAAAATQPDLEGKTIRLGSFRRTTPISRVYGFDRGEPVDRYYIGQFLSRQAADIRGRVLEIADNTYTRRFGQQRVSQSDIMTVEENNPKATIIADLSCPDGLPLNVFDCIICTQTVHLIYHIRAVLQNLHTMLSPGGVLLLTAPGISMINRHGTDVWEDYWRFTRVSLERLYREAAPEARVTVEAFGNLLAATAFLQGVATEELQPEELNYRDPAVEMLIALRAVKPQI